MGFTPKEYLSVLPRLRVGTYRETASGLFLDRNEMVAPFDAAVKDAIAGRIADASLNLYPDVPSFCKKLSQWLGVGSAEVFVTEGVSGAIKAIMETAVRPGDRVIFPVPTFALYPVYSDMFQAAYRTFGYTAGYRFDIDTLLSLVDDRTTVVFLPNPNVPIEGTLDVDAVAAIAAACKKRGTILAVDEVYYPFGGPTSLGLIGRFDNLLVMRSFSKAFGLAGIRLGYIAGNARLVEYVAKMRTGYEANTAAMETVSFFLENESLVRSRIEQVREGLRYLKGEFDRLGLEHNGGDASNFIFVNLHDETLARGVVKALAARRVFIRGGWPEPFSGGFSVTGGPKQVMEAFVKELRDVLAAVKV